MIKKEMLHHLRVLRTTALISGNEEYKPEYFNVVYDTHYQMVDMTVPPKKIEVIHALTTVINTITLDGCINHLMYLDADNEVVEFADFVIKDLIEISSLFEETNDSSELPTIDLNDREYFPTNIKNLYSTLWGNGTPIKFIYINNNVEE